MQLNAMFPTRDIGVDPAKVRDWAQAADPVLSDVPPCRVGVRNDLAHIDGGKLLALGVLFHQGVEKLLQHAAHLQQHQAKDDSSRPAVFSHLSAGPTAASDKAASTNALIPYTTGRLITHRSVSAP